VTDDGDVLVGDAYGYGSVREASLRRLTDGIDAAWADEIIAQMARLLVD
jgi:hypothetical protein